MADSFSVIISVKFTTSKISDLFLPHLLLTLLSSSHSYSKTCLEVEKQCKFKEECRIVVLFINRYSRFFFCICSLYAFFWYLIWWETFFFFSFLAIPRHMEFPGKGSDLSHSCHLSNCWSLTWLLNPLCWALNLHPRASKTRQIPSCHSGNS